MILVNFKKIIKQSSDLLRITMALVFISAGVFRIFNPAFAQNELQVLNAPYFLSWFIVVLEIIGGIWLLLKLKYWKGVVYLFILFLLIALVAALRVDYQNVINNLNELFVFDPNPTDIFLHIIFIIILFSLILRKKK